MGRNIEDFQSGIFHGTHFELGIGDIVTPANKTKSFSGTPRGGGEHAWATNDMSLASEHGPNVYEVAHLEDPSTTTNNPFPGEPLEGPEIFGSKKGFKVLKKIEKSK